MPHIKYRAILAWSLIWLSVLAALYLINLYSSLLFHSLAEIFNLGVAFGIFSLMWNSRRFLNNNYLLFVGIAYFFLGMLDTAHMLSYESMGVFVGFPPDISWQIWLGLRYIQGLTFVIAPYFLKR